MADELCFRGEHDAAEAFARGRVAALGSYPNPAPTSHTEIVVLTFRDAG